MLILTRKTGESVVVGNSIRLTVVEVSGGMVRLGFDAPLAVSIYRDELHRETADENRAAIASAAELFAAEGDATP
jgi:carbon storage regulator